MSMEKKTGRPENINKKSRNEKVSNNLKHSAGAQTSKLCPVANKCGGCQWIDKEYEEQLRMKETRFRKLMEPYCRPERIIGMENPLHYRNKVHAVFGEERFKMQLTVSF